MTRDTKVGLLVGLAIILLISIIVSDHLSVVQYQDAADLTQFAQQAQQSVEPSSGTSRRNPTGILRGRTTAPTRNVATQRVAPTRRTSPLPLPGQGVPSQPNHVTPRPSNPALRPDQRVAQRNTHAPVLTLSHTQSSGAAQPGATQTPSHQRANGSTPQPIIHYVRAGESLWTLAQKYYDDGNYWQTIADANPKAIQPTGGVREGVRLVIPNKAGLANRPSTSESRASQTNARLGQTQPNPRGRSQSRSDSNKLIEVRAGDSLSSLAQKHLGSSDRWRELFDANRDQLKRPDQIRVGMKLRVSPHTNDSTRAQTREKKHRDQTSKSDTYVVQPNDSLSSIAGKLLGDPNRWDDLYAANRGKLKNPDSLRVGQRLKVPPR